MQNYEVQRMNNHIGSDFDDFLSEQGLAEEVSAAALKRVIAWQITQAMKEQHVSKKTWPTACIPAARRWIGRSTRMTQA